MEDLHLISPRLYQVTGQRGFPFLSPTQGRGFHLDGSANYTATYTICGELHPPHDGGRENSPYPVCGLWTLHLRPGAPHLRACTDHSADPPTATTQSTYIYYNTMSWHTTVWEGVLAIYTQRTTVTLIYRQLIVVHTAVHHDSTRLLLTKYTRHVWIYTLDPHEKRFEFELYRYGGILSEYGGMLAGAESYHIAFLQNSTLEYCIYYISVFTTVSVYIVVCYSIDHLTISR